MPKKPRKKNPGGAPMTFEKAVKASPPIAPSYRKGIQALKSEHRKGLKNRELATGSIDLDAALAKSLPNDHRWDYGIGLPGKGNAERVVWLEVHHAASGETERVINKLRALKIWLQANAPALSSMTRYYVWQLSNVERNLNDRRSRNREAEKHGLRRIQGKVDLGAF